MEKGENEKDSKHSESTTVNPGLIWRKQVAGTEIHQKDHYNRGREDGGRLRLIKRKKDVKTIAGGFEKTINGEVNESKVAKLSKVATRFEGCRDKTFPSPNR